MSHNDIFSSCTRNYESNINLKGGSMITISRFKLGFLFAVFLLLVANVLVMAQISSPVDFSGKVTKVVSLQKKI